MSFAGLQPSRHLAVEHFESLHGIQFQGILDGQTMRALDERTFQLDRAVTALPGCLLLLERCSARRLEGVIAAGGCTVMVPMETAVHATANTQAWRPSEVGLMREAAPFDLIERHNNTIVVIRFFSQMQNRGWSESAGRFALCTAAPGPLREVRQVVSRILSAVAQDGLVGDPALAMALEDDLVAALDGMLIDPRCTRTARHSLARHRRLVARLDEIVRDQRDTPLYSDALAAAVGVSVRTLHAAVSAVHGSSPHHYIRMQRLWRLRCQLVDTCEATTVKAAAYDNGFWHMSELSRRYKMAFGETPTETVARGRAVRRGP